MSEPTSEQERLAKEVLAGRREITLSTPTMTDKPVESMPFDALKKAAAEGKVLQGTVTKSALPTVTDAQPTDIYGNKITPTPTKDTPKYGKTFPASSTAEPTPAPTETPDKG